MKTKSKGILWAVPVKELEPIIRVFPRVPHIHITIDFGVPREDVEELLAIFFAMF